MKRILAMALVASLIIPSLLAYKIRDFKPKPAKECPAFQEFQKIVIAASPRLTQEGVEELFDTKKMLERQIMPVVVVIENQNDFAVSVNESDIFLVDAAGTHIPSISFDVVLARLLANPRSRRSGGELPDPRMIRRYANKNMVHDFEHKAFGEKLIAPHDSDYGVVFFPLPPNGDLSGTRLYFPQVHNVTDHEMLMFFEFDLGKAKE
jgi:hypothetical protein